VVTVQTNNSALDEPLRWMLRDPRRLRVTRQSDFLWLRLLNVPAALTARRYMAQDTLTLRVDDPFMPALAGCYTLEAGPHGAACQATTRAPDLRLGVADLGAVYLGGARCGALAYAGRVTELAPGALRRADALVRHQLLNASWQQCGLVTAGDGCLPAARHRGQQLG